MILTHICCSVDSHYFLQKLQELYPNEEIVGFFYDPNIHPYSEYILRLLDVEYSCKKLGIELIEGEYDYRGWFEAVRGYEDEPEKGARCDKCFDARLEVSAKKAKELGAKNFTTTLLTSPKKSIEQLSSVGNELQERYGVEFLAVDFRKDGGTQEQFKMAREEELYHQDYCGCLYALNKQRAFQDRVTDELFMPITKQVLPDSIEERIENYQKRIKFQEEGVKHTFIREKFLNYRLLRAFVEFGGERVESYFLPYSILKRKFVKTRVEKKIKDIYFTKHENIYLVSLSKFNKLSDKNYKNIQDIVDNPLSFDEELAVRNKIISNPYSLSPIIVLKNIEQKGNYKIYLDSKIYEDTREHLVTLG